LIRTVVKGAGRPKSWFLGQYDLFQTCELVLYARSRNGLHVLKECSATNLRARFRTDWRAAAIASYLCDLVSRNLLGSALHPECFDLLSLTLDALPVSREKTPLTFWFELKFAHALGLSPSFTRCTACNRPLSVQALSTFSVSQGGLVCPTCPVRDTGKPLQLSPDRVAILRRWQQVESPHAAGTTKCSDEQCLAISNVLGMFIGYHLEVKLSGRHAAIDLSTLKDPSCLVDRATKQP